jgi:hypothetical protein
MKIIQIKVYKIVIPIVYMIVINGLLLGRENINGKFRTLLQPKEGELSKKWIITRNLLLVLLKVTKWHAMKLHTVLN